MEEKNNLRASFDENEIRMNRERRRRQEKESSKDYVVRMLLTQLVVSAVLVGVLFAVSKKGGEAFSFVKEEYKKITSTDMTVQEVWADLKSVKSLVFSEEKTTAVSEEKTTQEETEQETTESKEETTVNTQAGKGGDDITVFSATSSTLFSPFITSSKICVPVSGEISSLFGYRENPVTGDWSFHTGLDIAASHGENIKAAFYGKVTETGYDDVSGNYVIIDHGNDLVTKYMHCSEIAVKEGTVVRKGETVAYVGSTGRSTGPHLHFVMEADGKAVNPLYAFETDDGKI